MKKALLMVVCVAWLAASAQADPFINPPCQNWPVQWAWQGQVIDNPWITQFPYQRNIRYTFDDELNMFKPIYEGYDDDVLQSSDWMEVSPNMQWYFDEGDFTGVTPSRFGLLGIDNRQGTDNVTGWFRFHIDNWDRRSEWKHIWKEFIFLATPGVEGIEEVILPPGFELVGDRLVIEDNTADGWTLHDYAVKVWPNPPWEEILITVTVPEGGYVLLDEMHFATECVPEPATSMLAILGIGTLLTLRRRRRR